jgi:hypothetical protein
MTNFSWADVDCCWDVATPSVMMVDDNGKQIQDTYANSGNCMTPAFPPSASYIAAERGSGGEVAGTEPSVPIDVMATGDITST